MGTVNFEKGRVPLKGMQIGTLRDELIKEDFKKWERICPIFNTTNDSFEIKGDLNLTKLDLGEFPDWLKKTIVRGNFWCDGNNLTSLERGPKEVEGSFSCMNNLLSSLEHSPKKVKGNFWCDNNRLTSLKGSPEEVEGNFSCTNNPLETLEDLPEIKGNLWI